MATVKMQSPSGQLYDIHPDEVQAMKLHDFRVVEDSKAQPAPVKRKPGRPRKLDSED